MVLVSMWYSPHPLPDPVGVHPHNKSTQIRQAYPQILLTEVHREKAQIFQSGAVFTFCMERVSCILLSRYAVRQSNTNIIIIKCQIVTQESSFNWLVTP